MTMPPAVERPNLRYTVDASVFMSAFNPMEPRHAEANAFLAMLRTVATPVIVPEIVFVEVAATIGRTLEDTSLAVAFAQALRHFPNLLPIGLDEALSTQAAEAAARHRLRGSDAIYVAVAQRFGASLITLDREQQVRAPASVQARTPGEALAHS
jgi:predicted nucleic acid-binding protein